MACPSWPRPARADSRQQAHRQRRLPRQRLRAAGAAADRRRPAAAGLSALSAFSLTGYSGGGTDIAAYEADHDGRLQAPRPYAMGQGHKHLPEMQLHGRLAAPPVFSPIVGPFLKGLSVHVPLQLGALPASMPSSCSTSTARALCRRALRAHPAVRRRRHARRRRLRYSGVQRHNRVDLGVFGNAERLTLVSRLDNLGKGAAGSAVQNMNVHLGLEDSVGLSV
ncbi:hypothetical protein [Salinicola tamaricis]|uniref:hypothetical protein n=1 Tax=Salinicola tamaricis TaxID=1771309 RepID=UPI0030F4302E